MSTATVNKNRTTTTRHPHESPDFIVMETSVKPREEPVFMESTRTIQWLTGPFTGKLQKQIYCGDGWEGDGDPYEAN